MIAVNSNLLVYAHRRDSSRPRGPKVHGARIAALCLHGGARELASADRDFSRFPTLAARNPLV